MKNKFLKHLTKVSIDYVYKIFNVEKVYRDIDDLQCRVETIEDSDIADRVSDLEDKSILDFEPHEFVQDNDYACQMENLDNRLEDINEKIQDLLTKLDTSRKEQVKQRKAIEALCMTLGKKGILKILGEEDE